MGKRRRALKRTNKVIGFKAFHDTDGDLLGWWESIPEGERSDALRAVVREHLQGKPRERLKPVPPIDLSRIEADTTWLRLALTDLPGYIERVIASVAAVRETNNPMMGPTTHLPEMTDADARRREAKMKRSQW